MEGSNINNSSFSITTRANTARLELENLLVKEERGDEVIRREPESLID